MAPIYETADERVSGILDAIGVEYRILPASETPQIEISKPSVIEYNPDPSNFVFVPGVKSGKEKRPDLKVCMYRLGMSPEVEQAGRQLGIQLQNTARETASGREYVGNMNREQAIKLNLLLGGRTSDIRLARDFLRLILSKEALDGNRKKIKSSKLSQIADEITGVRNPWRGEWYEDTFTQGEEGLVLEKHYSLEDGVFVLGYSHKLIACLMEDKTPGIDLKNWLENSTAQGLPKESVKTGKLWYWHPRTNSASSFSADPGLADFYCNGDPQFSDSRLGVRYVREAHVLKK